jgi:hypothetical protein
MHRGQADVHLQPVRSLGAEEAGAQHYNPAALPGKRPGAHFELRGRSGRALKISHQSEIEPRTLQRAYTVSLFRLRASDRPVFYTLQASSWRQLLILTAVLAHLHCFRHKKGRKFPAHTKKVNTGSRGTGPLILNLAIDEGECSASSQNLFTPGKQFHSGRWKKRKCSSSAGIKTPDPPALIPATVTTVLHSSPLLLLSARKFAVSSCHYATDSKKRNCDVAGQSVMTNTRYQLV